MQFSFSISSVAQFTTESTALPSHNIDKLSEIALECCIVIPWDRTQQRMFAIKF